MLVEDRDEGLELELVGRFLLLFLFADQHFAFIKVETLFVGVVF